MIMNQKQQLALNELARCAAAVLDQMLRGNHPPTRMQCAFLNAALRRAVPHLTPHRPGLKVIDNNYLDGLQKAIDGDAAWQPKKGR